MAGPTPKTGTIAESETWDQEGSPYQITDSMTLSDSVIVDVEAGVEIEVQKQGASITLGDASEFNLGGTRDAPIYVHGQIGTRDHWTGFVTVSTSVIKAKHTTFENASKMFDLSAAGYLWLENCIIRECIDGAEIEGSDPTYSYIFLKRTVIERCLHGLMGSLAWQEWPGMVHVESEHFFADCQLRDNEIAIYHSGPNDAGMGGVRNKFYRNRYAIWCVTGIAGTITLEDCWWGSDSGPEDSVDNPTGTGDIILVEGSQTVDYTPWQTLGRYVPVRDDVREYVNRILREGTLSGEETATSVLDDESLDRMIDRAEKRVDRWMAPGPALEKRFLGYGSETQEMHDVRPGDRRIHLRYRPIVSVTLVEIRGGSGSSWSTVTEQESGGWYASEDDKRRGQIHIDSEPTFTKDSFRVTYTHGYYDAPEEVRAAVIRLVALDVFSAILQPGQEDPYTARARSLREDLKEMKEELLERKRRHVVF
jgi:hypothetical protein